MITAEDTTSPIKAEFTAAAAQRGIPLLWPSAADLSRNHLDYAAVATAAPATLAEIGASIRRRRARSIGRAPIRPMRGAVRWTYLFQDHSSEFSGPPTEAVNRAADTYAGLYAVSGTLAPLDIEVAGINDLKDYASVQSYLRVARLRLARGRRLVERQCRALSPDMRAAAPNPCSMRSPQRTHAADRRRRERDAALPTAALTAVLRQIPNLITCSEDRS